MFCKPVNLKISNYLQCHHLWWRVNKNQRQIVKLLFHIPRKTQNDQKEINRLNVENSGIPVGLVNVLRQSIKSLNHILQLKTKRVPSILFHFELAWFIACVPELICCIRCTRFRIITSEKTASMAKWCMAVKWLYLGLAAETCITAAATKILHAEWVLVGLY